MNRVFVVALFCFCHYYSTTAMEHSTDVLAGAVVLLDHYEGPAEIHARSIEKFTIQIDVDPKTETEPLTIYVELPNSGKYTWPVADVEVIDSLERAVSVRRPGIEWNKLWIPVPAKRASYFVRVAPPLEDRPKPPPENQRYITDPISGANLSIAQWSGGRRAALSIRFDDTHPTHLHKAMPLLREYGYRGTFMINPGVRENASENLWPEWEACARSGDFEFANHTLHHRGARTDEETEYEIGEASKRIWELFPGKSKLLALNLGGGTLWVTTKTLRYYLDQYHLFDASSGSLGMDDVYGQRIAALRRSLYRHIERRGWCRIHYHSIGKGLSCSEANFQAALETIKENESQLWIAGMTDIYKYQTERNGSKLELIGAGPRQLTFRLSCLTDRMLYNEPLTIEYLAPESWRLDQVHVKNTNQETIPIYTDPLNEETILRFNVPAVDASYTLEMVPGKNRIQNKE